MINNTDNFSEWSWNKCLTFIFNQIDISDIRTPGRTLKNVNILYDWKKKFQRYGALSCDMILIKLGERERTRWTTVRVSRWLTLSSSNKEWVYLYTSHHLLKSRQIACGCVFFNLKCLKNFGWSWRIISLLMTYHVPGTVLSTSYALVV